MRMEKNNARRRTWRSRWRCSASPSTRHDRKEPRLSSGSIPETARGSSGIIHLQSFSASVLVLYGKPKLTEEKRQQGCRTPHERRSLRRKPSGGRSYPPGDQRRARRDVRLRASSKRWTPSRKTSSLRVTCPQPLAQAFWFALSV